MNSHVAAVSAPHSPRVIPGRDEVASPESIATSRGYGFRACASRRIHIAQLRNVE
jgi:hypothetical protein